jgi:superfamily I DNA/RNA helicase/RecB family exonuclease
VTDSVELDHPEDWERTLAEADGPQLVVGGPGSGKTEFLVRRAVHLIADRGIPPERVLLLSFSRRGAADLRSRITARLDRSVSQIPTATFHSLAMRIVEAHGASGRWERTPTLLTGPEHVALVADVLAGEEPANWPMLFRGLLGDGAFAEEVADFVLRSAERLADGEAIAAAKRAEWRGIPGFLERYRATLLARDRIDYGTLQAEAVRLLDDPDVRAAVAGSVDYVLIDEYQDTTVAQAAIAAGLAAAGNITAAGDPYQSIYSFRGAELSNVADFAERFTSPERPVRRMVLTRSFRVPERILEAAVRITSGAGLPGAAGPMQPAAPGGSVETYAFAQHTDEAEWIASEIQRIHLLDGIPYAGIAVMVRSKRSLLAELSRSLDRRGIPHDRPDARLVDHPAVRPVLDLVRAATTTGHTHRDALRRVLLGPFGGLTLATVRDIERRGSEATADPDIPETVRTLLGDAKWATQETAAAGFWRVWTSVEHYREIVADDRRSDDRRAIASFAQALDRLAERDASVTLVEYLSMTESEDFEATPLLEYHSERDRLVLTTLHQSKGLTFDVVFIADAREGILPDLRRRDSLLGARHLSPSHSGDDTAYAAFRLQEEKRLAYSAMCRATTRVVWTCTTTGFDGGDGMPSRFLPLVADAAMEDAAQPPSRWTTPTTPLEAEAWLRRRIGDPELPMADRLASVAAITTEAPWRPRHPATYAGVLERGPDRGIVEPEPVLSASQADAYARCPRRYVFERRLGIDGGGSQHQHLGSLLHDALESAERAATARGDERATVDEALAAVEARFEPEDFGGGAWAEAWRRRALAIVERLYALWPGKGPGVAFEVDFQIDLAGATWRGRIDRIERRGDTLHVVDYKTGTSLPSLEDAATSMQLGLYAAASRGGDLGVGGAEFWYPWANRTGASVAVRSLDMDRLPEVEEALGAAAQGIIGEEWDPVPGAHCERCPVRLVCPQWPEGREAFVG